MSEKTNIRKEKRKGLSDKELIEKYDAGKTKASRIISIMLSKPSPNAPTKVVKRHT